MLRSLRKHFYRGHSPYYYLRKILFILKHWDEFRRRRRFVAASEPGLLDLLRRDGWCRIALDPAQVKDIVSYCGRVEQETDPNDQPPNESAEKDFWRLLIDRHNVQKHPEIIRFAQQNALKNLASAYLGEEAVFADIALMKSYPTGRKIKHSQLWHLDALDSRLLLFYVYCRDVDENAGPFSLIPKTKMKRIFRPRFLRKHGYTDAEITSLSQTGAITPIRGPAGTVFACDTAITYHQGSRCEMKTRLALAIRYTTFSGLHPVHAITLGP